MKILITGGKTVTALKLIKSFENEEILLGDYGEMPKINTSSYSFVELGNWNAEVLAHNLLTKCLDNGVEVLLPLYEAEILALSKSLVLFEEFGLKVLLPENPQIEQKKANDLVVLEKGKILYATAELGFNEQQYAGLNGAYYFDADTSLFTLISVSNPA